MAPSRDGSDEDGFDFNDLSHQPSNEQRDEAETRNTPPEDGNNEIPKPKRIACVLCRKRKLKCDSRRPSCSTCVRLQHDCSYDEVRKKSGPKRGYVKALEARLAQVETLLKSQDEQPSDVRRSTAYLGNKDTMRSQDDDLHLSMETQNVAIGHAEMAPHLNGTKQPTLDEFSSNGINNEGTFPWEMIGLGLDEPLPTQDVIDDLNTAYFEKVHSSMAMIHRPRYYAAMNLAPHARPPVCLRYAMWALAASVCEKYEALQEHFYNRARKYLHQDEMRGHGESMITVAHVQTWVLVATFEFKMMFFPRAWMSAGRGCRLAQMMGLHRVDGAGLDVKQCLPPPKDEIEREERRRSFWMTFCVDRYSSIGTGWPMVIEERDIHTNLPTDEDAFEAGKAPKAVKLSEVTEPAGVNHLAGFSGVVLLACLFGRNLTHLHRPSPDDRDDDLNGEFWKRHRAMDNILLATALGLPDKLRLPAGLNNPNIVFVNMSIHTSTICLHQAAIFKADRNRMPARISAESKVRCITAAAEIATIMRTISHLDLSAMNPFVCFCLYVAARVFVQYLKSRPNDHQVKASLQFLLSAMHAIKRKNPLTESFLVQLDVDLEGAGLEDSSAMRTSFPATRQPDTPQPRQCPYEGRTNPDGTPARPPAYGDIGLAVYNNPDASNIPEIPVNSVHPEPFRSFTDTNMGEATNFATTADFQHQRFDLPSRQRSPGSLQSSGNYRSPANMHHDMDISPDGSGNDQHTPNSSSLHNVSSHTSNTAYSPQHQDNTSHPQHSQRQHQNSMGNNIANTNMFDPTSSGFSAGFDMNGYTTTSASGHVGGEFVLPSDWSSNGMATGLTPNVNTGFTSGATTGLTPGPEVMGMSDAEWSQMLEGLDGGWNTGVVHEHSDRMEALLASRR